MFQDDICSKCQPLVRDLAGSRYGNAGHVGFKNKIITFFKKIQKQNKTYETFYCCLGCDRISVERGS